MVDLLVTFNDAPFERGPSPASGAPTVPFFEREYGSYIIVLEAGRRFSFAAEAGKTFGILPDDIRQHLPPLPSWRMIV